MSENSYNENCEAFFAKLEDYLDNLEDDIDYESNGEICEITLASGVKLIVNRQPPVEEIWLAAKSGGYHFRFNEGNWFDTRDNTEFFARLQICLLEA